MPCVRSLHACVVCANLGAPPRMARLCQPGRSAQDGTPNVTFAAVKKTKNKSVHCLLSGLGLFSFCCLFLYFCCVYVVFQLLFSLFCCF